MALSANKHSWTPLQGSRHLSRQFCRYGVPRSRSNRSPLPPRANESSPTETSEGTTQTPPAATESVQHSFRPGEIWLDSAGQAINAHGGGFYHVNGLYYWFGEHKGIDAAAHIGIHVYSSTDLYNWHDEGIAFFCG